MSKSSTFTHDDLVTIATPRGRITLSGTQFIQSDRDKKLKKDLTAEEKQLVLITAFGIYPESLN